MLEAIVYIVATGVLWGCTNPLIKRGTRGLRLVRRDSLVQQLRAEACFLLSNWRYMFPWLVNQLGSACYVRAVTLAPLSVSAPAANALAFAATAATGAALGDEEPLDKRAILGMILVLSGTAMCCCDQLVL